MRQLSDSCVLSVYLQATALDSVLAVVSHKTDKSLLPFLVM